MKKVYCLYRVSTEHQVEKNDIPMQRKACQAFAAEKGWSIEKEYYEKGISGFKISANDRDAIQDIKYAAARKEFDILLVFMFDRLGRRDDETPFVVEWFVRNGIAVWSVQEGEQRFDTHIDKLLNYIQFWQASGESIKTSIRTRTRMEQLTREGYYTGGTVPYGYRLVHRGRMNRQNREVYDLAIDPQKAEVVRLIYQKYAYEGMGTHRIARHLTQLGVPSTKEDHWHAHSISYILQNPVYTGLLRKGEAQSDRLPELQIISDALFEKAQHQRLAYADQNEHTRWHYQGEHMPMLLLGMAYCGYCGKKLIRGTSSRKRVCKDGTVTHYRRYRYLCYTRMSHKDSCGGQAGYSVKLLEETVLTDVSRMLQDMQSLAYINEYETHVEKISAGLLEQKMSCMKKIDRIEADLADLNGEVVKSLRGESELGIAVLQSAIEHTKSILKTEKQHLRDLEDAASYTQHKKRVFLDTVVQSDTLLDVLHGKDIKALIELLHSLIKRIDVYGSEKADITYRFSLTDRGEPNAGGRDGFNH